MSEMNKKFLKELEKEEQKEKITIQDLHLTCSDIIKQNEEIKALFTKIKHIEVKINKTHLSLLGDILNRMKSISIPEKIKLQRINTIDIANSTRKWLMYYFACSFLIVVLSVGFAFYSYQYEYKPKHKLQLTDQQNEWLLKYVENMGLQNPKTHNEFVSKKAFPE